MGKLDDGKGQITLMALNSQVSPQGRLPGDLLLQNPRRRLTRAARLPTLRSMTTARLTGLLLTGPAL
jgi:hypothetical protein